MSNVLIFDTETTGTDPSKDRVIEVGCILFSIEHVAVVSCFSSLIHADGQPAEAEAVNGIPSALLKTEGITADAVWKQVRVYFDAAKAILAHNADFDRAMVPEELRAMRPWICTQDDLAWPKAAGSKGLVATALAHGVGVSHAHRALTDCDILARLLVRLHETGVDVRAFLRRGLRPKAKFRVAATGYDEARNALAKAHGFRFDPPTKSWVRSMAIEDAKDLPFEVKRIDPPKVGTDAVGGPLFDDPLATWNKAAS